MIYEKNIVDSFNRVNKDMNTIRKEIKVITFCLALAIAVIGFIAVLY